MTGGHEPNVAENAAFVAESATVPPHSEYEASERKPLIRAATAADMRQSDLIPYEHAAAMIGIEPKRLLGRMLRNKVGDPIGGQTDEGVMVYEWSLEDTRKRLAHDSDLVTSVRP